MPKLENQMPQPKFNGDLNQYIKECADWMDNQPERETHTMTVHTELTLFRRPGAKASLASVAGRLVAKDPVTIKHIFKASMQRKIDALKNENKLKQKRIDELERKFKKELQAEEDKEWEDYGEDL